MSDKHFVVLIYGLPYFVRNKINLKFLIVQKGNNDICFNGTAHAQAPPLSPSPVSRQSPTVGETGAIWSRGGCLLPKSVPTLEQKKKTRKGPFSGLASA